MTMWNAILRVFLPANISITLQITYTLFVYPLIGTLKLQSNGPLYSNMVISTSVVHGWAVKFGTARRGLRGLRPSPMTPSPVLAAPNVTAHPSTASVTTYVI